MIKFAKLKGFKNLGEMGMMSHIYRWVREENKKNLFIFLNGYESNKMWIGYLENKEYENVKLSENEEKYIIKELSEYVGEIRRVKELKEFAELTQIEYIVKDYKIKGDVKK